jgi:hypothetical protein
LAAGGAIIMAAIFMTGVFLNVYLVLFAFVTVFLWGMTDPKWLAIQYWLCLAGGAYTSFVVSRSAWRLASTRPVRLQQQKP